MKLTSRIFLISYALFFIFCLIYVINSKNAENINSIIFAVSGTGVLLSVSDFFYTKTEIDKNERNQLFSLYISIKRTSIKYEKQIYEKNQVQVERIIALLECVYTEDEILKIYTPNKLSDAEKNALLLKISDVDIEPEKIDEIKDIVIKIFNNPEDIDYDEDIVNDNNECEIANLYKISSTLLNLILE